MKKVLVPLADGFEEIETMTIVDVLRRAGLDVVMAGIKPGELRGSRRVKILPDAVLDDVKDQDFDMIILPGGQPGVDNLRRHPQVLELLKRMSAQNKKIGAICAAPLVLRDAGLISGVRLTSFPGIEGELAGAKYDQGRIVVDGNVVTSRGPGTAMEFSLKIVELLCGKDRADELAKIMLVQK